MSRKVSKENTSDKKGRDFYADAVSAGLIARPSLTEATVQNLARQADKNYAYLFFKRTIDIAAGVFGSIFLIPCILFIKLGNILTGDFKPMFLKQPRVGKDGEIFHLLKFRSMVMLDDGRQADALLDDLFAEHPELKEQWEKYHKLDNDPRITKMGKFIRKTSIDEIPQFFNILKGDMSLIGPRPLVIGELDEHNGDHDIYESVKPGLTGWWACNGRSEMEYDERLELEYFYAENANMALDTKIVMKTIKSVLKSEGAK